MKTKNVAFTKQMFIVLFCLILINASLSSLAQNPIPDEGDDSFKQEGLINSNATPDKLITIMLNVVGGDALINGLTLGRGGGNSVYNSAFGSNALHANTTGFYNNAYGYRALYNNSTGSYNNAIGSEVLFNNSSGMNNTAIGSYALFINTTGSSNTALGRSPLYYNTTGYSNIAIGGRALYRNTIISNLVAVGDSALFNNGLGATGSLEARANTAIGSKALFANTTGFENTAVGFESLTNNKTGFRNTATGYFTLVSNTNGSLNTANGDFALYENTSGFANTAIGFAALQNNTSNNENTAVGYAAGWNNTIQGTFLGANAYASASGYTNITGIGYNAMPNGDNTIHLGNTSVVSIKGQVGFTTFSDGNYKTNIREDVAGLEFILKLRPVSYNVDVHKLATDVGEDVKVDEEGNKEMSTPDEITLKSRDEKSAIREVGFVAQEVEALVNEMGVAFNGVDAPQNETGQYGLRYASFVVPLVKAVQEQQAQIELLEPNAIEALQLELTDVSEKYTLLEEKNRQLEEKNTVLESKVDQILALLLEQGIELGDNNVAPPSRVGSDRTSRAVSILDARLEQNAPNPFHENTVIRYYLPEYSGKAQLIITDLQGNRIQTKELTGHGQGEVSLEGGSLAKGTYVYSLIVNGQLIDSKRMVLL